MGQPSTDSPPFLASDETFDLPPVAESAPLAKTDANVLSTEGATAAEARVERLTPEAPEAGSPRSSRLARGLASFSLNNADREKKFRHILSDGDAVGKKE